MPRHQICEAYDAHDAEYESIYTGLDTVHHIIEERFLNAGNILVKAIGGTKALIQALDSLKGIFDAGIATQTKNDLNGAAQKLAVLPEHHAARTERIRSLDRCSGNMADYIAQMHRNLAYIRAYTFNIKIVASAIPDAGDEFCIFADDITACIGKGVEQINNLDQHLTQLQNDLQGAEARAEVLEKHLHGLLPAVPDALTASADRITDHYGAIANGTAKVTETARNVQKFVTRILAALQVGDATRQRIEHIMTAISDERRSQAEALQNDGDKTFFFGLVAAQLSDIAAEFTDKIDEIERSMAGMAVETHELLALHNQAFCAGKENNEGFLHSLAAQVDEVEKLVLQIEDADRAAMDMGREAVQTAAKISDRIEAIQVFRNEMHFMSLNTALKCCQIGEAGRPLNVIAEEIQDQGEKLERTACEVLTILDELISLTHTLSGQGDAAGKEQNVHGSAAHALHKASERITQARDIAETNIAEVAAKGIEACRMITASSESMRFRDEICSVFDRLVADTLALNDMALDAAYTPSAALRAYMSEVAATYTMASEQNIHDAYLQSRHIDIAEPPPANDGANASANDDDDDGILF